MQVKCVSPIFLEALNEILDELYQNAEVNQIRQNCQNDLVMYVHSIIPLSIEIQSKIIKKYGFDDSIQGFTEFNNLVHKFVTDGDQNLKMLSDKLRNFLTTLDATQ